MASQLAEPRLLTVAEFLQIEFGAGLRAELDNGVIRMMAGASRQHSRIQTNLIRFLGNALRGSGCRPYGSDMGVRPHDASLRYPDVTVDCGTPDDQPQDRYLSDPRVVFEILSPSTRRSDLGVKKEEYRAVASIDTIVFIDPEAGSISVNQRHETGWSDGFFASGIDVPLPALGLVVPAGEVFATD